MTNRVRMKKIINLEERYTVAKLNALNWLHHAMYLKLEQLSLCREAETRLQAQLKLMNDIKFLQENEGILSACTDAFLPDEPPEPLTDEQKKELRWIKDGGKPGKLEGFNPAAAESV